MRPASTLEERRLRRPLPFAPASRGFTVIELLVTLAVISIVALIAIPNLLNSLDHAKQKKSMASIRSLGLAVEKYSIDRNAYPVQAACGTVSDNASIKAYTRGNKKKKDGDPDDGSLAGYEDGWGNALRYRSEPEESYTLCSGGKDGSDCCTPDVSPGVISRFENDLIYVQGTFVTYPEGQQE